MRSATSSSVIRSTSEAPLRARLLLSTCVLQGAALVCSVRRRSRASGAARCRPGGARWVRRGRPLRRAGARPGTAAGGPAGIRVVVDSPGQGATIQGEEDVVEVRGTAIAAGEEAQRFDVMVVLDVSGSTRYPSGADVDGDGVVGENPHEGLYAPGEFPPARVCTDPDDTILARRGRRRARARAEPHAGPHARRARHVLGRRRPGDRTRSGSRDQKNAELQVPLTADFARVESGLAARARARPARRDGLLRGHPPRDDRARRALAARSSPRVRRRAQGDAASSPTGTPTSRRADHRRGRGRSRGGGERGEAREARRASASTPTRSARTRSGGRSPRPRSRAMTLGTLHAGARAGLDRRGAPGGVLRQRRGRGGREPDAAARTRPTCGSTRTARSRRSSRCARARTACS